MGCPRRRFCGTVLGARFGPPLLLVLYQRGENSGHLAASFLVPQNWWEFQNFCRIRVNFFCGPGDPFLGLGCRLQRRAKARNGSPEPQKKLTQIRRKVRNSHQFCEIPERPKICYGNMQPAQLSARIWRQPQRKLVFLVGGWERRRLRCIRQVRERRVSVPLGFSAGLGLPSSLEFPRFPEV